MSDDEAARHALFRRLEQVLGPGEAATMMASLPPTPWDRLATKDDLRAMESRLESRFDLQHARFEALVAEKVTLAMATQTRTLVVAHISTLGAAISLTALIARLV